MVRLRSQLLERRTCFLFRVEIDPPPSAGWRCFASEGIYNGKWNGKVVTRLEKLGEFYLAEDDHQDYLQKHPDGYTCHYVRKFEW